MSSAKSKSVRQIRARTEAMRSAAEIEYVQEANGAKDEAEADECVVNYASSVFWAHAQEIFNVGVIRDSSVATIRQAVNKALRKSVKEAFDDKHSDWETDEYSAEPRFTKQTIRRIQTSETWAEFQGWLKGLAKQQARRRPDDDGEEGAAHAPSDKSAREAFLARHSKLTISAIGTRAGVQSSSLYRWRDGKQKLSLESCERLARFLKVKPEDIP